MTDNDADKHRQKAMNAYLGKFNEREMKTTVKHVGSVRDWEGLPPIGTKAICKYRPDDGPLLIVAHDLTSYPTMALTSDESGYWGADEHHWDPVPMREPKCGEVYEVSGDFYIVHSFNDHAWIRLDGQGFVTSNHQDAKYSAPSSEAFYARKALERYEVVPIDSSAGLDYQGWLEGLSQLEK